MFNIINMYSVSTKKPTILFSTASSNRSNFWHSDLRENGQSAYDSVFHLTPVMPMLRAIDRSALSIDRAALSMDEHRPVLSGCAIDGSSRPVY